MVKTKIELGVGDRPDTPHETWIWQDVQALPNIDLVCDAGNLPLPDNSIDEMFSNHLIEHFFCMDMKDIFIRWHKILKQGGKMVHHFPDFEELWRQWLDGNTFPNRTGIWADVSPEMYVCWITANGGNGPQAHHNFLPKAWYEKTLKEVGFDVEVKKTLFIPDLPCLQITAIKL